MHYSIFIVLLLFFVVVIYKNLKKTNIYNKGIERNIQREILYLEFSIKGGNSPFNNFKRSGEITLLSNERLRNIKDIVENIIKYNIEGDILEAGNWRGGSMLYTKGVLEAYGVRNKRIWMFDTFSGFPNDTIVTDEKEKQLINSKIVDVMKSNSVEKVKTLFNVYNLSKGINIIEGKFTDTISTSIIPKLSFLRLDADSYDNTKYLLDNLYNKLNKNGYVEFDDYGTYPGCKRAVEEFRLNNNINNEISYVYERNKKYEAVFWQK